MMVFRHADGNAPTKCYNSIFTDTLHAFSVSKKSEGRGRCTAPPRQGVFLGNPLFFHNLFDTTFRIYSISKNFFTLYLINRLKYNFHKKIGLYSPIYKAPAIFFLFYLMLDNLELPFLLLSLHLHNLFY